MAMSLNDRLTKKKTVSRYQRPSNLEMARTNVCLVEHSKNYQPVMGGTNAIIKKPDTCLTYVLSS